jgi:hypothetical protein
MIKIHIEFIKAASNVYTHKSSSPCNQPRRGGGRPAQRNLSSIQGLDSDENLITASRSILIDRRAKPLSRSSRRYTLLRPCASLTFICVSTDATSSGNSYRRQKPSTGSFPQNPGVSRAGSRRRDSLYSVSAPCRSSSDIFSIDDGPQTT